MFHHNKKKLCKSALKQGTLIEQCDKTCLSYLSHTLDDVNFVEKTLTWKEIFKCCSKKGLGQLAPAAKNISNFDVRTRFIRKISYQKKLIFMNDTNGYVLDTLAREIKRFEKDFERLKEIASSAPKLAKRYYFKRALVLRMPIDELSSFYNDKNDYVRLTCVSRCNPKDILRFMGDSNEKVRAAAALRFYKLNKLEKEENA